MESLRWILLAAGAVFVVVVYFLGRNRRQRNQSMADELEDDLPEFAARSLDDVDEGVGEVRIVTSRQFNDDLNDDLPSSSSDDVHAENRFTGAGESEDSIASDPYVEEVSESSQHEPESEQKSGQNREKNTTPSDIVVLYILSKPGQSLMGSQINSSVQAMGLKFGEMNIFHYKDGDRTVFSLANMLEPGAFDPMSMHDIKTSGLTVFMQMQQGDPLDDLTEMLQRSYQLAGLLDARLCNHKREPLTAQDAEDYRAQVAEFISAATEDRELSSET